LPRKAKPKIKPGLPEREAVLAFVAEHSGKVGVREIARAFGVPPGEKVALKRMLRELADEGLVDGRRKRLHRPGDLPSVTVLRVEGIDDQGEPIGVPVEWDEAAGTPPRIVIAGSSSGRRDSGAPGIGDRVLARLTPEDGTDGFTARVIKLLERSPKATLGIYREAAGEGRIVPVDRRGSELSVPAGAANGARDGELVSAEAVKSGRYGLPSARVAERIGDASNERAVSLIALHEHGIPYIFPLGVLDAAEAAQPAGMAEREDWRELPLVTIDPPDARDHDDAVHAAPDPGGPGFVVTVAIADVAQYVRPGSPMDVEAQRRGNSVYFPGRVVPMLPERISNDLCSLREGEDRPALAVRMRFDAEGRKTGHSFHRIMMRSAAKLSYEQAQAAIDGAPDGKTSPLLAPVLEPLWRAYAALARARDRREPLAIDLPERKVLLKEDGSVDRIIVPPRLEAHRLIEEFMIQANVGSAETLEAKRTPVVYRIHDEPSWEKLEALREFLGSLDMSFPKAGSLRPSQFNRVLARVAGTPNAHLVNEVILRSQSQAEYSVANIGHFGLNLRRYAHFTSPIRRYADLLIHRALIAALKLGAGGMRPQDTARLDRIAGEISVAERRAMAAERDTVDRLVAFWLSERVGARFEGRIRGVTRAGLFVELEETGADGFVPISTIGSDFYEFQEAHHRLVGRRTGETFRLGDSVEVRLVEALPYAGRLRLELLWDADEAREAAGPRRSRRTRGRAPQEEPRRERRKRRA
jgi:ribonuclease R